MREFCLHVALWVGVLLAFPVAARGEGPDAARVARAVALLQQQWQSDQVPSGALSIVDGDTVAVRSLGRGEAGGFELASSSKAFTGLLIADLEQQGLLSADDPVMRWIPELRLQPAADSARITVRHLLEHTSGIPEDTLGLLRPDDRADALSRLPQVLAGVRLVAAPGTRQEYATLNYSLLGLIAERAAGERFDVLARERIFAPLGMRDTYVEAHGSPPRQRVAGYRIAFGRARPDQAPRYLQNTPAGYVVSTPADMARWLQFQLALPTSASAATIPALARLRAARDAIQRKAPATAGDAYVYGWDVHVGKTTTWSHPGQNPDATAYVAFDPGLRVGVAMMGNSNSPQVEAIGSALFGSLTEGGKGAFVPTFPADGGDRGASAVAIGLWSVCGLALLAVFGLAVRYRHRRGQVPAAPDHGRPLLETSLARSGTPTATWRFLLQLAVSSAVLALALAVAPTVLLGMDWPSLLVWGPGSLPAAGTGVVAAFAALAVFFRYAGTVGQRASGRLLHAILIGKVVGLTAAAGLMNSLLVLLIIQAIEQPARHLPQAAALLGACIFLYIAARRTAELQIMRFGHGFVQMARMDIIARLLAADYQDIARLSPGKIQSVVGEDAQEMARSMLAFVPFLANLLTITFLFAYLMVFQSAMATCILLACAVPMVALYYHASQRAGRLMPQVLDTRSDFMDIVEDLQKGYKGLRRRAVKRSFLASSGQVSARYMDLRVRYDRGFLNAFFIGESLLVVLLAAVALLFPIAVPSLAGAAAKDYMIILLYLIGPLNAVMSAMPELTRMRGLLDSMQSFRRSIRTVPEQPVDRVVPVIRRLELRDVGFAYPIPSDDERGFAIGPVGFTAHAGRSYFLTGGNGSGKSTLALLIAGLHAPAHGTIYADGHALSQAQLLEQTRCIFNDNWLSRRVYDPDVLQRYAQVNANLALLGLEHKTALREDGMFETIALSTGQRKRLALALLLADDSPIVVLDEWAAEQDPISKRHFYREWLPQLKAQGRIVFVITHDDEYFADADAVITMKDGRIVDLKEHVYA
ncbi:MAG: serine hydrolase [Xanthomonas sp.]